MTQNSSEFQEESNNIQVKERISHCNSFVKNSRIIKIYIMQELGSPESVIDFVIVYKRDSPWQFPPQKMP